MAHRVHPERDGAQPRHPTQLLHPHRALRRPALMPIFQARQLVGKCGRRPAQVAAEDPLAQPPQGTVDRIGLPAHLVRHLARRLQVESILPGQDGRQGFQPIPPEGAP